MRLGERIITLVIVALSAPAVLVHSAPPGDPRDFDGDGFDDLLISVESESIGGAADAGAAHVLFGSANRLTAQGDQFWHQNKRGIDDAAEPDDRFGRAMAIGDFNGDGRSDAAIAAAQEDLEDVAVLNAGVVHVLYGSAQGLQRNGEQFFSQNTAGISGTPNENDQFGITIAAADFDGDGFDDLAIGVPTKRIGGQDQAGAVHVLYGSPQGLDTGTEQYWHLDRPGVPEDPQSEDYFGLGLGVGDFDGDERDDLAIGIAGDVVFEANDAGSVMILYGSNAGLSTDRIQYWNQNTPGIADQPEPMEFFGAVLTAGDFDGDGRDDLAISAVGEAVGGAANAGAVHVLYGSNNGLAAAGDQFWHQNINGIPDFAEAGEQFGTSMASGDFDRDGNDDLAIGVPKQNNSGVIESGTVHIIYGSSGGLTTAGTRIFNQNTNGVPDLPEEGDAFGGALTTGDFDGNGFVDLAVGAWGEQLGELEPTAGAVHVLYGSNNGLRGVGSQFWSQNSTGIADVGEGGDTFGIDLGK